MYRYEELKPKIFTEEGQEMFLRIRDNVNALLKVAGVVQMQKAINGCTGDTWHMMACVDRLVELNEIREIKTDGAGQHRIFVATN